MAVASGIETEGDSAGAADDAAVHYRVNTSGGS